MPYKAEFTTSDLEATIEYNTATSQVLGEPYFTEFFKRLVAFHAKAPLSKFEFLPNPNGTFLYKLTALDGRVCQQTLRFEDTSDPWLSWDISHEWKQGTMRSHRDIRDQIVLMKVDLDVVAIVVDFV